MDTHLYDVLRRRRWTHPDAVALGGQDGLIWRSINSQDLLALVDSLADELATRVHALALTTLAPGEPGSPRQVPPT